MGVIGDDRLWCFTVKRELRNVWYTYGEVLVR